MSAPEITGLVIPDYEHTEYPKIVYKGGASHVDGALNHDHRTVGNSEEEAAAAEDGYTAVAPAEAAEEIAEEAAEDDAGSDDEDDAPSKPGVGGQAEGVPATTGRDNDQDGHDDKTGKFVSPNPGRRGRRRR